MSKQKVLASLLVVFALIGQQAAAHFIEDVPADEASQAAAHGKRIPSRGSKAKSKAKAAKSGVASKAKSKAKKKSKPKAKAVAKKPSIAAADLGSSTSSSYPAVTNKPLSQPTTRVTTHKVTVMPVVFANQRAASNPPNPELEAELNSLYPSAPAQVKTSAPAVAPARSEVSTFSLVPAAGYQNFDWAGTNASSGSVTSLGGYTVGASVLLGSDNLHYETGLYYAERGIGYDGYLRGPGNVQVSPVKGAIEYRASYIEIPAFVRYAFFERSRTHVFLKSGVVLDVLQNTSSTIDYKNGVSTLGLYSVNANATPEDTLAASLKETDLRWAVGGGGVVKIWDRVSVTGQGLYERSFTAINKSGLSNFTNAGFSLSLGALIEL